MGKVYLKTKYDNEMKMEIPHNHNFASAMFGFREMAAEIVPYHLIDDIYDDFKREDIALDYIDQCNVLFNKFGVTPHIPDYPDVLKPFLGRKIWKDTINSISRDENKWSAGYFVKPAVRSKAFTGKTISSIKDLMGCGNHAEDYEVLVSESLDIAAEWRCFITYDEIIDVRPYGMIIDKSRKQHTTRYNTDYVINYPGFHSVFGVGLDIPARSEWLALDDVELKEHDIYKAAIAFGKQINKRIEELGRNSHLDVIMIYIPKEYEILTSYEDEVTRFDLHDYVKAFAVQKHISTQFIREKTLDSELDCQIAWAISLAIYVKAGRTPWVLSNLRTDTAFAGIGYSVNHFKNGEQTLIGCSHIYASDGQGLRYKLSKIKDVTFDAQKNPYLSENEAYQLGLNIKELFFSSFSSLPKRVVIHKRTPFKEEEIAGLTKCLGSAGIKDIDLIEITYDENFKCFEYNKYLQADLFPVKRGCCFAINDNTAYLFTHGIAPSVISNRRYFQGGTNVPAPLKIVKHYGNGDLAQIASEILGLSKMNWNSFGLYSKLPCTIQSSNAIAKVGWLLPQYEGMIYEYRNFM